MAEVTAPKIRSAFYSKLREEFYVYLRKQPLLSEWNPRQMYALVSDVVNSKTPEINFYLDTNKFPIREVDKVVTYVVEKILAPEIEKLTI